MKSEIPAERPSVERILNRLSVGILLLDTNFSVTFINQLAQKWLGSGNHYHWNDVLATLQPMTPTFEDGQLVQNHASLKTLSWADFTEDNTLPSLIIGSIIGSGSPGRQEPSRLFRIDVSRSQNIPGAAVADSGEGFTVTLIDVTEEKRRQRLLEKTLAQRDDILAMVSHDLRSPLHSIGLVVDEFLDENLDVDSRKLYVRTIRRSIARSEKLLRDLVDVSAIESANFTVTQAWFDGPVLFESLVNEHRPLLQEAGMQLELRANCKKICADRDRISQAVANLISNSAKHGRKAGSTVSLVVEEVGDGWDISVSDQGAGVKGELLENVFDRFSQGRRSRGGGSGLGLTIVRGIAVAHGGSVSAKNNQPGATFMLHLPRPEN